MNAELSADGLTLETTQDGQIICDPEYCGFLRSQGYVIEDILEAHTVKREGSDTGHMVAQIETYQYPQGSEKLDLVEHRTNLWVCDCGDYTYRKGADVREDGVNPTDSDPCPHIKRISKVEQAKDDDKQTDLLP